MNPVTSALSHFYRAMQRRHPGVLWHGDEARREIAITFDDGPHPRDTPQVLETLARHGVHATFFLIGRNIERYPSLVEQIHREGHQIGIHCYRHLPFPLEHPATLRRHLEHTRTLITGECGVSPDTLVEVRPPYGFFTGRTRSILSKWGYRLVLWNNMPLHFLQPVQWTTNQILGQAVPGSIIVMHDGKGHGSKVAHIVDIVIPRLKAMGFGFVTIEQMRRNLIKDGSYANRG
jgi:peptidoglycan/xylan/chitin deacetylase (PgdA/CDA1 family)